MQKRYLVGFDEAKNQWFVKDALTDKVELCANYVTARLAAKEGNSNG